VIWAAPGCKTALSGCRQPNKFPFIEKVDLIEHRRPKRPKRWVLSLSMTKRHLLHKDLGQSASVRLFTSNTITLPHYFDRQKRWKDFSNQVLRELLVQKNDSWSVQCLKGRRFFERTAVVLAFFRQVWLEAFVYVVTRLSERWSHLLRSWTKIELYFKLEVGQCLTVFIVKALLNIEGCKKDSKFEPTLMSKMQLGKILQIHAVKLVKMIQSFKNVAPTSISE